MSSKMIRLSTKRIKDLRINVRREHLLHNSTIEARITDDYLIGILIDYYLERR